MARRQTDSVGEFLRLIAALLVVCGVIGFWSELNSRGREFLPDRPLSSDVRFQTDNAVGATANAVEWIAKQTSSPLVGNATWIGLALWVIASLRRTRIAIERLADELAPLKLEERASERLGLFSRLAKWNWTLAGSPPLALSDDDVEESTKQITKKKAPPKPAVTSKADDTNWPKL